MRQGAGQDNPPTLNLVLHADDDDDLGDDDDDDDDDGDHDNPPTHNLVLLSMLMMMIWVMVTLVIMTILMIKAITIIIIIYTANLEKTLDSDVLFKKDIFMFQKDPIQFPVLNLCCDRCVEPQLLK